MIMIILLIILLQLVSKPQFSLVEKIKTIGSTYMVAAGLTPHMEEVIEVAKNTKTIFL